MENAAEWAQILMKYNVLDWSVNESQNGSIYTRVHEGTRHIAEVYCATQLNPKSESIFITFWESFSYRLWKPVYEDYFDASKVRFWAHFLHASE